MKREAYRLPPQLWDATYNVAPATQAAPSESTSVPSSLPPLLTFSQPPCQGRAGCPALPGHRGVCVRGLLSLGGSLSEPTFHPAGRAGVLSASEAVAAASG